MTDQTYKIKDHVRSSEAASQTSACMLPNPELASPSRERHIRQFQLAPETHASPFKALLLRGWHMLGATVWRFPQPSSMKAGHPRGDGKLQPCKCVGRSQLTHIESASSALR